MPEQSDLAYYIYEYDGVNRGYLIHDPVYETKAKAEKAAAILTAHYPTHEYWVTRRRRGDTGFSPVGFPR